MTMRVKELEEDYRFISDPDLQEIQLVEGLISEIKKKLPRQRVSSEAERRGRGHDTPPCLDVDVAIAIPVRASRAPGPDAARLDGFEVDVVSRRGLERTEERQQLIRRKVVAREAAGS